VQQWLGHRFDDALVRFRGGPFNHQAGGLSRGCRHFADQPRKALEGMMQRQDAQAEHRLLQFADQALEQQVLVLERHGELARFGFQRPLRRMSDGILGDQQFTGQPDEAIDPSDVDAQGRLGRLCRQRPRGLGPAPRGRSGSGRSPRHRRRVAGEQAGLQQAFEVGRVQPVMAQHIRGDPAGRPERPAALRTARRSKSFCASRSCRLTRQAWSIARSRVCG
jgi:hypothetical protein